MTTLNDVVEAVDLDEHAALLEHYREAKDAAKSWKEREDDLRSEIVHLLGEAKSGNIGGALAIRRISYTMTKFDRESFDRQYPGVYEEFSKPGAFVNKLQFPSTKKK